MWIWAGHKIFRLQWGKVELIVDGPCQRNLPSLEETPPPNFLRPPSRSIRKHRLFMESVEAVHAALLTWNCWKFFKKGGMSFLKHEVKRRARCGSHSGCSDVTHCQDCQSCAEALLRNVEFVLEHALKSLWQEKVRILLFGRRYWNPDTRHRVTQSKRRQFDQTIGLCKKLDEWLHTLPAELAECYYTVQAAFSKYRYNVLEPMWKDICRLRREEVFDSLVALITHLANVLAALNATGTQTALALKERKLLCTSRGGLANEQHFYSILIAHLSTIAPQLAHQKALVEHIPGNHGETDTMQERYQCNILLCLLYEEGRASCQILHTMVLDQRKTSAFTC